MPQTQEPQELQGASERRLSDLTSQEGPPLTTSELARMTGMSPTFIRAEIRTGYLPAVQVGRGRKRVFRIRVCHAHAYAQQLGLI
jgi:excisionase family DNA binding protein